MVLVDNDVGLFWMGLGVGGVGLAANERGSGPMGMS